MKIIGEVTGENGYAGLAAVLRSWICDLGHKPRNRGRGRRWGQIVDAHGCDLDGLACGYGFGGNAEQVSNQHALAGRYTSGRRGDGDHVASLDEILHRSGAA
jgi:hypothetical protein